MNWEFLDGLKKNFGRMKEAYTKPVEELPMSKAPEEQRKRATSPYNIPSPYNLPNQSSQPKVEIVELPTGNVNNVSVVDYPQQNQTPVSQQPPASVTPGATSRPLVAGETEVDMTTGAKRTMSSDGVEIVPETELVRAEPVKPTPTANQTTAPVAKPTPVELPSAQEPAQQPAPTSTPVRLPRKEEDRLVEDYVNSGIAITIRKGAGVKNNNPGNLIYAGQPDATRGTRRSDGTYWAVFETPEKGLRAMMKQIQADMDRDFNVKQFVMKYAPAFENNIDDYIGAIATSSEGVSSETPIASINIVDLVKSMIWHESHSTIDELS